MKFRALVLELQLPQNFCHTDRQTDIFQKQSNRVQDIPKRCKSIENRKSKICKKPILSSSYIDESKKGSIGKLI